jgi:hypothetical protein
MDIDDVISHLLADHREEKIISVARTLRMLRVICPDCDLADEVLGEIIVGAARAYGLGAIYRRDIFTRHDDYAI